METPASIEISKPEGAVAVKSPDKLQAFIVNSSYAAALFAQAVNTPSPEVQLADDITVAADHWAYSVTLAAVE